MERAVSVSGQAVRMDPVSWDDDWDTAEFIPGYQGRLRRARMVCTCRQMDAGICEYCDGSLEDEVQELVIEQQPDEQTTEEDA